MDRVPPARRAAFVLFGLLLLATVLLHLGPALLAGLFSYTIIDAAHRKLAERMRPLYARWLSILLFAVAAVAISSMLVRFTRQSLAAVPAILDKALPRVNEISGRYGVELPFDNIEDLKRVSIETLKENAGGVTAATSLLTKGFFHVLVGLFVAVLCFLAEAAPARGGTLYDAVRGEFAGRVGRFMASFERVIGAQVLISGINTFATAAFLLLAGFPHIAFLVPATFICGMLPVIGNIISNTIIFGTGLTLSLRHAAFALGFLVVIHKGEYFLNSRIVGSSIQSPMWLTLLGILLGEAVMGVPGIVLAPAMLHYAREELQALPPPEG